MTTDSVSSAATPRPAEGYAGDVSPQLAWQVRAGVRNLTDETYMIEGQEFASVGNIQTAYYGLPRNWYVSLRYNF